MQLRALFQLRMAGWWKLKWKLHHPAADWNSEHKLFLFLPVTNPFAAGRKKDPSRDFPRGGVENGIFQALGAEKIQHLAYEFLMLAQAVFVLLHLLGPFCKVFIGLMHQIVGLVLNVVRQIVRIPRAEAPLRMIHKFEAGVALLDKDRRGALVANGEEHAHDMPRAALRLREF